MGLKLTKALLNSRVVRRAIAGDDLIKRIDLSGALAIGQEEGGGLLARVWNTLGGLIENFGEFLFDGVRFIGGLAWAAVRWVGGQINFQAIWSWLIT